MATRTRPRRRGGRVITTTTTTNPPPASTTGPAGDSTIGVGPTSGRCGPEITAKIAALEIYFATHKDSDDRGTAYNKLEAEISRTCKMTPAQLARMSALAKELGGQAHEEEESFDVVGRIFGELGKYLKVAAGGLGLLVSGIALVYVAGRNVPGAPAVQATRKAVRTVSAPARVVKRRRSTVSDSEYAERRGMERAARQMGSRETSYEGIGRRLPPRKRRAA